MFTAMQERLKASSSEMLAQISNNIVEIVPQIVLAIVVFVIGAVVASIARKAVLHLFDFMGLDKLANKVNVDRGLKAIGIQSSLSKIVGLLVYWLIILMALVLVSDVLKLGTVSEAIGAIVSYIPHLIAGLLILVIGLLIGRFFRDAVSTSLARANIASSAALGFIVQAVIIIFVSLLALKQVGLDVSVITTNIAVILGVLLVTSGLAVALAIRPVLENYFICRQLKCHLHCGDQVECDGVQGEVIEISLTSVVVRQGDHDVIIPARLFFEQRFSKKTHN